MAANVSPGRSLVRSILDSNPFYLISACCMLAGCLALTNSLSWVSIPTPRLLILISTLNAYEAALIALAAYLVLRRGLRRDGMILIVLELFFLIDVTFLVSEIATQKSWIGPAIAAISYLAAMVKLAIILRILGVRRSPAEFAFIMMQIAAILAAPIIFSRHDDGAVSPRAFYVAWWVVGLMPVVYDLLEKLFRTGRQATSRMMLAYVVLPWLSLVAHLGILHYVYDVPFFGAMAAPLLLALAWSLKRVAPASIVTRPHIFAMQILLTLAAVFVSLNSPAVLTVVLDRAGHLTLTTFRLATIGAYMELIYIFLQRYWIAGLLVGATAALVVAYGPTADQIERWAEESWNWASKLVWKILPNTQNGWGATAVVAAFVFLALGAAVSLRRSPLPPRS